MKITITNKNKIKLNIFENINNKLMMHQNISKPFDNRKQREKVMEKEQCSG
jgi:hypothetical protein